MHSPNKECFIKAARAMPRVAGSEREERGSKTSVLLVAVPITESPNRFIFTSLVGGVRTQERAESYTIETTYTAIPSGPFASPTAASHLQFSGRLTTIVLLVQQ
eukprot:GHVT01076228.1.p2 GENE.GHVT01076228.1~~GHVT01076228.1.p2  ORF type:complete len:104 (+),score=2.99 GHVT01076228.1:208-519(+)